MLFKGKGYVMHEGKVHQFVNGVLDVKDVGLIEKMKQYYEYLEVETEVETVVDYESMTNSELKKILDEKEISYNNKANKSDLIKLIAGVDWNARRQVMVQAGM